MSDCTDQTNHFALLIAAPHPGETAMFNDLTAMAQALLARGFSADEILCLHGRLDRPLVIPFLQAASRRVAGWTEGSVFLHVSGHGFFTGDTVEDARPGLLFEESAEADDDGHLFWDEIFAALALPRRVKLTLLPDL
jgi:hypothetical protein